MGRIRRVEELMHTADARLYTASARVGTRWRISSFARELIRPIG
jgi:hypothetical protein